MRIAIDTHAIGSRLTGNERYICNLAEQLLALDSENEYSFFFSQEEAFLRWENRAPNLRTYKVSRNPMRRLGLDFILRLRNIRPEVFHYQYTGPLVPLGPEIVTVHDVSFERHPEFFAPAERVRLMLTVRRAVKTARRIITVSEFSKREILSLLGVPEQKVKVIYNGVGPEFRAIEDQDAIQKLLERYRIGKPYLLAVGNICRRKNQLAMLRGFAHWLGRNGAGDWRLVLVGKALDSMKALLSEQARLGLDNGRVAFLGWIPDKELPYLYSGAEALLNTSLYEGFGLPLVEAMACGIPVVASRASCFPEIAGDAARYVDPDNPVDIADGIEEVIDKGGIHDELVQRGLRRARLFCWKTAARETLQVYQEATNGRGA